MMPFSNGFPYTPSSRTSAECNVASESYWVSEDDFESDTMSEDEATGSISLHVPDYHDLEGTAAGPTGLHYGYPGATSTSLTSAPDNATVAEPAEDEDY